MHDFNHFRSHITNEMLEINKVNKTMTAFIHKMCMKSKCVCSCPSECSLRAHAEVSSVDQGDTGLGLPPSGPAWTPSPSVCSLVGSIPYVYFHLRVRDENTCSANFTEV